MVIEISIQYFLLVIFFLSSILVKISAITNWSVKNDINNATILKVILIPPTNLSAILGQLSDFHLDCQLTILPSDPFWLQVINDCRPWTIKGESIRCSVGNYHGIGLSVKHAFDWSKLVYRTCLTESIGQSNCLKWIKFWVIR